MELPDIAIDPADFDLGLSLDMDAFDAQRVGIEGGTAVETTHIAPPRYIGTRQQPVLYDNATRLARDVGPAILSGRRIDALLSGNFIFGDFIEALLVEHDTAARCLTLSTLALAKDNVDSLRNLLAGDYLGGLEVIVSDYWYSHNRRNVDYVIDQLGEVHAPDPSPPFRLAVAGTHTKIALLNIPAQNGRNATKLVIHGSANLRSSRSVEVFTAEHNPDLFDFHLGWHRRILEHYPVEPGTAATALRAGALWDHLATTDEAP